jgi:L-asparaginase II
MQQPNPILVEVTRGPAVESIHRGAAAVVDRAGRIVASWGDVEHPVYPRSAVKPIQAVPLLVSGAARAFGVSRDEIALACASHNGEAVHTRAVRQWLRRLGYGPEALECGVHLPQDAETRRQLEMRGEPPSALHNNCSGKHAGFLTLCRHMELSPTGYVRADHPVQRIVRGVLEEFTGCSLAKASCGIDGCGIPVYGIPLRGLASAMMKFTDPEGGADATADAVRAIRDAMTGRPYLVAGRNRFCTEVMEALAPHVLVKTGAEGVFCAALLDRGLGVALKIDDGATRAAEVAVGAVLRSLGAVSDSLFAALRSKLEPDVVNVTGRKVGTIRASAGLLAEPA